MNVVLRSRNGYPVPAFLRTTTRDESFGRLIDSMFNDLLSPSAKQAESTDSTLRINVSEHDKGYEVEAALPGASKENIKISVDGKKVSIEAEVNRTSTPKQGETLVLEERQINKFARSFTLPVEIDEAGVVAKLENGILTLSLPKKEEKRAKQITIQ